MLQRRQSFLHKKYKKETTGRYSVLWILSGRLIVLEFTKEGIPVKIDEWSLLKKQYNNTSIPDLWFEISKSQQYAPLKTVVNNSDLWLFTCQPFKEPYELLEIDYNRLLSIGLKENLWCYFIVEDSWQHFRQAGSVITHVAEPLFGLSTQYKDVIVSFLDSGRLWVAFFNSSRKLFFFNVFEASGSKEWIFWHVHISQLLDIKNVFLPIGSPDEWKKELGRHGKLLELRSNIKPRNYEPNLPIERYFLMLNFS